MFRCYDFVRTKPAPLPNSDGKLRYHIDVMQWLLWFKSFQWLDKIMSD